MQNRLREAVARRGRAVGTFLSVATPSYVESISSSGLDYVVIDTEHGSYDTMRIGDMVRAADSVGLCPVVRVSDATHKEIQHAVDEGAEGIIVPCLRRVEDFRRVVELGKFAPVGNRGFAKARGCRFGNETWAQGPLDEYMRACNEKVLLLPQCETAEALEHIEEIAAIDGIDGIFVGPFDLSICLGIPARFDDPRFTAAIERVLRACRASGKLSLIFTASVEDARRYLAMGFDAVANGLDTTLLAQHYRAMVDEIRK